MSYCCSVSMTCVQKTNLYRTWVGCVTADNAPIPHCCLIALYAIVNNHLL